MERDKKARKSKESIMYNFKTSQCGVLFFITFYTKNLQFTLSFTPLSSCNVVWFLV